MIGLLDLHAHTTASGHAYNSPYEMVHSALVKGLSLFRCSDHALVIPGSCHSFHLIGSKVLSRTFYGVRLIIGMELNIMDHNGTVDLEQSVLELLGYAVASLHQPCIHSGTALQNTNAYLGASRNPLIRTIGHPDDSRFPIDYDILVIAAREHHKLLEVSNSSLNLLSFRVGTRNNYIKMLELCRHYGASIVVNSGTRCEADMSSHASAYVLLEEVNFSRELIVNTFLDRLRCFLSKATAILVQREDERYSHLYRSATVEEGDAPGGNES